METKKNTVVEWLNRKIIESSPQEFADNYQKWIEIAKAMEQKQIIKTAQDNFYAGQDLANGYDINWNSAEEYYNETYGIPVDKKG